MKLITKVVLVIIIIVLVYSLAKLISARTTKHQQIVYQTMPISQNKNNQHTILQSTQTASAITQTMQVVPNIKKSSQNKPVTKQIQPTNNTPNAQGLYQVDEILINGESQAGQNYIDITSNTPITPQNTNNTQNNSNNSVGAYAEASITVNNNNSNSSAQTYAPGVPAFEVIDGD